MTMFEEAPKTITAMTEKELRQDNWRLKGKIDKLTAQIKALKSEPKENDEYLKENDEYLIRLNNALADENKRLRRALNMQQAPMSGTPNEIIQSICNFYSVTEEQLKSSSRKRAFAKARHLAAYVLQAKGFSFKHIGQMFGNRDHSTMIHAKKNAIYMIDKMDTFEQKFVLGLLK